MAVVSLAILFVGFKFLKGIDLFDPANTYYVVYDNIDGLTVSNPVEVNGYRVGRVSGITLLQEGAQTRMLVSLDINDDLKLYAGTEARLQDSDFLGGKSIVLNLQQGGRVLNENDTLLSTVDESLTEMIQKRADPIVAEIDTTLVRVNNILSDLSSSGGKVDRTMGNFEETAEMLKFMVIENRREINAVTANLRQLSATLTDPQTGIGPFMVKMNQLADSLNDLQLQETVASANAAMNNIQAITAHLEKGGGSAGKMIYSDSLYVNLNQSAETLNKLLQDIQANPGRYIDLRFSLIGGGKK